MKKITAIISTLLMMLPLASCGGSGNETEPTTMDTETVTETEQPTEDASDAELVSIGNTITTSFAELTVDEAAVADDIQQSISSGNITYTTGPERSDTTEYVYIRGSIKNTSKSAIDWPTISGNVSVDGYEYEISNTIIEADGSGTNTLEPLMSYQYTLYAAVPNELAQSFTSCTMDFGFEENLENVISIDDDYAPEYRYTINIAK